MGRRPDAENRVWLFLCPDLQSMPVYKVAGFLKGKIIIETVYRQVWMKLLSYDYGMWISDFQRFGVVW